MVRNHGLNLTIGTESLQNNYALFEQECPGAEVASVVKADAYGCGLRQTSPSLAQAGCRTFFVAHLNEAIELRQLIGSADIYVLNGLLPETEPTYRQFALKPVITSQSQLFSWIAFCQRERWSAGAALHVDTGINRLGFQLEEVSTLADLSKRDLAFFDLLMSHFACADEPENQRNLTQIDAFTSVRRALSGIPRASLASSAGCFLGPRAHFDLVRPGIGLFGGNPFASKRSPFETVITISAPLIQVKLHRKGEHVGYGSDFPLDRDTLIGTISVGYADGLPRRVSRKPMNFFYNGVAVKSIGRISMDMTLVDLSNVRAHRPQVGDEIEICGGNRDVDAMARELGTIPNEILTSFGRRANRQIKSATAKPMRFAG